MGRSFLVTPADVTCVTKDVSSKTADRSRDISAWRSVQEGYLEEYTDSATLLPPSLHLESYACPQRSGSWFYNTH